MADVISTFWKLVYIWTAVSLALFAVIGGWQLIGFVITYALVFGGMVAAVHPITRAGLRRKGRTGPLPFLLVAVAWSCFEELWCNAFGCKLAISVLWADLVFVSAVFTAWLATWYFVLARRFRFTSGQAIIMGSLMGAFFEVVLPGHLFSQPLAALLITPLAILIYRTLFVVPFAMMEFTGTRETPLKYAAAIVLPVVAAGAAAVVVFIVFTLVGAPLA